MKFAIIKGLPYLISGGKRYPVAIDRESGTVTIDRKAGRKTKDIGRYTLTEIFAKCQTLTSMKE